MKLIFLAAVLIVIPACEFNQDAVERAAAAAVLEYLATQETPGQK